jgi:YVTN family beta-propeller protein
MYNQKILAITVILLIVLVPLSNRPVFADDGVIATVGLPPGSQPLGITINPNGEAAVADNIPSTISTISTTTNTVKAGSPIVVGSGPYGIIFDSSSNRYFVANNIDSTISVIRAGTHNIVDTITLPTSSNPTMLALDPVHHYIFSANSGLGTVSVINTTNDNIVNTISVNSNPFALVLDSSNGYVYTANNPDIVSVINSATNPPSLIQNITIPSATSLDGIEFNPTNGNIYVSDGGASSVYVINGLTLKATIPVGVGPQSPGYDPNNGNIYVPTIDDNSVSVINGTSNSATQTLSLLPSSSIAEPFQAVYNSINKHVYVTDTGSSQVSVIGSQSKTIITLSPSSVNVGVPTTVSVSVAGSSPTGTVSFTTTTGSGSFSNGGSCTLVSGTCSVTFTPTTGPVKITATYSGDSSNISSAGEAILTVTKPTTTTTLTLSPSSVTVNSPTTVSVSVSGTVLATGTVTFTVATGSGSFSANSCTLLLGTCSVTFTPSSAGSVVITGKYNGDTNNAASSTINTLTVTPVSATTVITLSPSSVNVGVPTTVSVSVAGSSPTGTVSFTTNSTGSLSAATCTLNSAKCSVTFTPSSAGSVVITGKYNGDTNNAASSGQSTITVTQNTGGTLNAYNQFDPTTKNVLVYGIDGNGVSFGPIIPTVVKTSWNGDDDYNLDNHDHDANNLVDYDNHNNNGGNGGNDDNKHNNGGNGGNDDNKHNNGDSNNHENIRVSFVSNLVNSVVMTSWSNINYDINNLNDITFVDDDNHNHNSDNTNNQDDNDDSNKNNGDNDKSGAIYNHDDDNKNAELRTFQISEGGNSLILVEKVLMENDKITVHVISVQRNGGSVIQMPQNLKMFEWTNDQDNDGSNPGNMETFQQTMIITSGKVTQQITTSFDDDKKQTVIYTQNINENFKHKNHLSDEIVKNGLVYLRMLTHQNSLTIGTSS